MKKNNKVDYHTYLSCRKMNNHSFLSELQSSLPIPDVEALAVVELGVHLFFFWKIQERNNQPIDIEISKAGVVGEAMVDFSIYTGVTKVNVSLPLKNSKSEAKLHIG
ncbi:Hypothetical predicted protein [Olea europaea subsp. europaea]|uniref:Uncharacterized protein n=1 Tax=Olea europaea subsp. europaea TaxID=158383 RepID=A0A8S0RWW4_OLEEU|nr:Hypothetical predicted protein [Olea europaea subsp. europaea]